MTLSPYQIAYEQAAVELTELMDRFEQLRSRKGKLETLIAAFRPLIDRNGQAPSAEVRPAEQSAHFPAQNSEPEYGTTEELPEPAGYSFADVPNPLPDIAETGGDPFQRRVRSGYQFRGLGHEQRGMQRGA